MLKKYLTKIEATTGAVLSITVCTDSFQPYHVFYCGLPSGHNYITLGGACRYIDSIRKEWDKRQILSAATYETKKEFNRVRACDEICKGIWVY